MKDFLDFKSRIMFSLVVSILFVIFFVSANSITLYGPDGYEWEQEPNQLTRAEEKEINMLIGSGEIIWVEPIPGGEVIYMKSFRTDLKNCLSNSFSTIVSGGGKKHWRIRNGWFEQVGDTCVITSLLNANMRAIVDANAGMNSGNGMTLEERSNTADALGDAFDRCVRERNSDNDPNNNIPVDELGIYTELGEPTDAQLQSVMECKNQAMRTVRESAGREYELHPRNAWDPDNPNVRIPRGLVVPGPESWVGLFGVNPVDGTIYPGSDDWCTQLAAIIAEGGQGVIGLGGSPGHMMTVTAIDCTSTPPTMTIHDPNGNVVGVNVPFNIAQPGGQITLPNGVPGLSFGPGTTVVVVAGIDVVPNPPSPGGTTTQPGNGGTTTQPRSGNR